MTAKSGSTKTSLIILVDAVSRSWIGYRRASLALPQDVWALSKAGGWDHLKARSLSRLVGMLAVGLRPQFFSTCNLPTRAWLGFLIARWLDSKGKCPMKETESSPAMSPFLTQPQRSYGITFTVSSSLRQSQNHPDSKDQEIDTASSLGRGEILEERVGHSCSHSETVSELEPPSREAQPRLGAIGKVDDG